MPNELNNNDEEINEDFADLSSNPAPLSRNRKIAVAVLAFFGLFVIVFWFAQFQASLKKPLQHNTDTTANSNSVNSSANGNNFNADDEALKNKDTDGDGLFDWDELHTYKTSPYLEDSDGDGYNDKQEIDTGNDPNCPRGQTCVNIETNSSSTASQTNNTSTGANTNNSATQEVTSNVDAQTLRSALEANGFDKNTLNAISDEDLLKAYNESLNSASSTN